MQHHRREHGDHSPRPPASQPVGSSLNCTSPPPTTRSESRDAATPAESRSTTTTTSTYTPTNNDWRSGDLMNGVGSTGSSASADSSVFSAFRNMSYSGQPPSLHALTPLTSTDSSPPSKLPSPRSAMAANGSTHANTTSSQHTHTTDFPQTVSSAMTPVHTPPDDRIAVRPIDGKMGVRILYDPMLDPKNSRLPRHERSKAPHYKEIIEKGDPSPPPDPRLAIAGYTSGTYVIKTVTSSAPKTKLRLAPYVAKPYAWDHRLSCTPPATQVVVTGFDPLTPQSQIQGFFSAYGRVAYAKSQTDPSNGSFLGIALIRFDDTPAPRGGVAIKAASSAKRAEREGTNQRIGVKEIKVQLDREGRRCERLVAKAVEQSTKEKEKLLAREVAKSATPATPVPTGPLDLPANVPKGPSGKGMRPPPPMVQQISRKHALSQLVEHEPVLPRIKRTPYIFIAHQYVPVLGTTIEHLKKRLKNFYWKDVRCDASGYFVLFENSKRGEDETVRCYKECHMTPLFTYVMNMECQQYGNPSYERSPSPERAAADMKRKAQEAKIREEDALDFEFEKKCRAGDLDPVNAAIDLIKQDLRDKILSDLKSRLVAPTLYDLLATERQAPKRRKLNIPDPPSKDVRPPMYLGRGDDSPATRTPDARSGFGRIGRKALAPYDQNRQRGRRPPKAVFNAFADERRRAPAPKRQLHGLHRAFLDRHEPDEYSDDEGQSSFTRDTEEQESRPLSRASSSGEEDDEIGRPPAAKRRRTRAAAGWGEESDDELVVDDKHARSLLAHLIEKDPEQMAEKELEQVLAILPRSSPLWKKANKVLKGFKRLRQMEEEADALFFPVDASSGDKLEPEVIITNEDEEAAKIPIATTEVDEEVKPAKKKVPTVKSKRKTKKQLQEEAKVAEADIAEVTPIEEETPAADEAKVESTTPILEPAGEVSQLEVDFSVSAIRPQRTVDDDANVVMDIDGWQHLIKDDEDLKHLAKVLLPTSSANIKDIQHWAQKQKQIKHLNRKGAEGVSRTETKVEGYYVPNSTGSARTEGVKKILESEKSKYLPHRIRVQKEREERERRAKQTQPHTVVEGFKFVAGSKTTSTANSRANRANNRRLAHDINTQKQGLTGAEGDAIRFNQLKKRKKLVKFDRSAIHNWGLYAEESIVANDMIIEYVGEKVRQRVADLREAKYDMQGVGSSYLFRIDEDTVIDATKMGGIARFINHSCMPNCTAKIIRVDNTKRIVIYALRDIVKDEELTYDYKFEREIDATDRIPCLCGSVGCKGFLN